MRRAGRQGHEAGEQVCRATCCCTNSLDGALAAGFPGPTARRWTPWLCATEMNPWRRPCSLDRAPPVLVMNPAVSMLVMALSINFLHRLSESIDHIMDLFFFRDVFLSLLAVEFAMQSIPTSVSSPLRPPAQSAEQSSCRDFAIDLFE